jgi:hypothetical protein
MALFMGLMSAAAYAQTATIPNSGAEEGAPKTRLSGLVPELSDLLDTTSLHILSRWCGFGPGSPIKVDYKLVLKNGSFVGRSIHSEARQPTASPCGEEDNRAIIAKRQVAIPRDAIRVFLSAVLSAPAEEGKGYTARMDHTDDYPTLAFELKGRAGRVIIGTASQPTIVDGHITRAPWAILYVDRIFVVSTCEIDRALEPLSRDYLKEPRPIASPFVMMQGEVRPPEHC